MSNRMLLTGWVRLLAILGGSGGIVAGVNCCGGPFDRPPVKIRSVKLITPDEIKPGSTIAVSADVNYRFNGMLVELSIETSRLVPETGRYVVIAEDHVPMWDDGSGGDQRANDNNWYGEFNLSSESGVRFWPVVKILDDSQLVTEQRTANPIEIVHAEPKQEPGE